MTSELRECPFCGGEAEMRSWEWPYARFQVRCGNCGSHARGRAAKEEDAIAAWNTRHRTPDMDGVEPVAWRYRYIHEAGPSNWTLRQSEIHSKPAEAGYAEIQAEPLYTAPPLSRPTDEAEGLLREARDALQPFGNPEILMQIAEDDDEEWAKFRLLCGDYRRAGRAIVTIDAHLSGNAAQADTGNAALVEGQAVVYAAHGCRFEAIVTDPDDEGWVKIKFRSDGSDVTVRPSHIAALSNEGEA